MGQGWNKNRRYDQVLSLLGSLQPKSLISHRYNLGEIHQAFCSLDHSAENEVLQIAVYPETSHQK
jgi:hypothetical protein